MRCVWSCKHNKVILTHSHSATHSSPCGLGSFQATPHRIEDKHEDDQLSTTTECSGDRGDTTDDEVGFREQEGTDWNLIDEHYGDEEGLHLKAEEGVFRNLMNDDADHYEEERVDEHVCKEEGVHFDSEEGVQMDLNDDDADHTIYKVELNVLPNRRDTRLVPPEKARDFTTYKFEQNENSYSGKEGEHLDLTTQDDVEEAVGEKGTRYLAGNRYDDAHENYESQHSFSSHEVKFSESNHIVCNSISNSSSNSRINSIVEVSSLQYSSVNVHGSSKGKGTGARDPGERRQKPQNILTLDMGRDPKTRKQLKREKKDKKKGERGPKTRIHSQAR